MKLHKKNLLDGLFIGTILFFVLGMIHITLAVLGIICMVLPFLLRAWSGKKLWCTTYCPRASLFNKLLKPISLHLKSPKWLFSKKAKKAVLIFFFINLFFITMSTLMVALGRIEPMLYLRLFIAFKIPLALPQFITIDAPQYLMHLGYRFYSVMLTTTMVGLILGILYRPRAWCNICPIQTLTK